MVYFFCKLRPPRKTFAFDMTARELEAMRARGDYWLPHVAAGTVIVMGEVADPDGAFSVAVVNAPSRARLEDWQANDPAMLADLGFTFQNFTMPTIKIAPLEPQAPV